MRLSIFMLVDGSGGDDPVCRSLEIALAAERLGYDGVWIAEHHFGSAGRIANPAVFLAALAARTWRVRLGPAVAVLPLRDPVQVAEDYALVDRISGGRLSMGVGSGSVASEFAGFGASWEDRHASFERRLARLERLWSGAPANGAALGLGPAQDMPPLHVATFDPGRAEAAGRRRRRLLTMVSPSDESLEPVAARLAGYRRGAAAKPADAPVARGAAAVAVMTHAAGSRAMLARELSEPMARFQSSDTGAAATRIRQMTERRTALFGTADDVAAGLGRFEALGVDELILWVGFGGMDAGAIVASLGRIASKRES